MRSSALSIVICLMVVASAAPCLAGEVYEGKGALEMMRKMYCGTVEDGRARFGTWEGRAYSRVQGEKDRHLFNVIGINTRQCATIEDPEKGEGFRSVSREVMFYLDPGLMIVNATGFSTFDLEDLPDAFVEDLKERYPRYLTAPPLDDHRPNETSWTVFKKYLESQEEE